MKLILTIFLFVAATLPSIAKSPVTYVGHRGSLWGVENTKAAFINGAKHYPYLECDIRMTADSVFVISHDETTERLGGKLEVAKAPLADLLAEEYLQTRRGTAYAGRLSTLDEYLTVCRVNGVKPLIEFKWTPGINSDDQSMIPALLEQVKRHGFIDSCIILTSMRPCLEFVMKNYPNVNVQFLGGAKWKNAMDWIKEHHIDVDLLHTAVTAEDVKMLHDMGLKVNVWTVDDPVRAAELAEMGVDFITTNSYFPQE